MLVDNLSLLQTFNFDLFFDTQKLLVVLMLYIITAIAITFLPIKINSRQ
jgi:hypothetical protein